MTLLIFHMYGVCCLGSVCCDPTSISDAAALHYRQSQPFNWHALPWGESWTTTLFDVFFLGLSCSCSLVPTRPALSGSPTKVAFSAGNLVFFFFFFETEQMPFLVGNLGVLVLSLELSACLFRITYRPFSG